MMSDLEFSKATNLRNTIRVLERLCGDVELVEFETGGISYRTHNQVSETDLKVLDDSLGMLTTNEENTLKELYL